MFAFEWAILASTLYNCLTDIWVRTVEFVFSNLLHNCKDRFSQSDNIVTQEYRAQNYGGVVLFFAKLYILYSDERVVSSIVCERSGFIADGGIFPVCGRKSQLLIRNHATPVQDPCPASVLLAHLHLYTQLHRSMSNTYCNYESGVAETVCKSQGGKSPNHTKGLCENYATSPPTLTAKHIVCLCPLERHIKEEFSNLNPLSARWHHLSVPSQTVRAEKKSVLWCDNTLGR